MKHRQGVRNESQRIGRMERMVLLFQVEFLGLGRIILITLLECHTLLQHAMQERERQ